MEHKDLKHMGREDLLQLLIQLTIEKEELQKQLALKEEEIVQLRKRPSVPEPLNASEAGSIAQAALQINHVFENSQRAADQYLENIARMQREQAVRCQKLLNDAKAEANRLLADAHQRIGIMEASYQRADLSVAFDEHDIMQNDSGQQPSTDQKKRNWRR